MRQATSPVKPLASHIWGSPLASSHPPICLTKPCCADKTARSTRGNFTSSFFSQAHNCTCKKLSTLVNYEEPCNNNLPVATHPRSLPQVADSNHPCYLPGPLRRPPSFLSASQADCETTNRRGSLSHLGGAGMVHQDAYKSLLPASPSAHTEVMRMGCFALPNSLCSVTV